MTLNRYPLEEKELKQCLVKHISFPMGFLIHCCLKTKFCSKITITILQIIKEAAITILQIMREGRNHNTPNHQREAPRVWIPWALQIWGRCRRAGSQAS